MVKIKGLVRFRFRLAPVATEVKTNLLPSQLVVEAEFAIAVITVEHAAKISFVYNCMQTRLRGQYNGK